MLYVHLFHLCIYNNMYFLYSVVSCIPVNKNNNNNNNNNNNVHLF